MAMMIRTVAASGPCAAISLEQGDPSAARSLRTDQALRSHAVRRSVRALRSHLIRLIVNATRRLGALAWVAAFGPCAAIYRPAPAEAFAVTLMIALPS